MKSLGNINLMGNQLRNVSLENKNEYPTAPSIGALEMIQKRLMLCVSLDQGVPFWLPMSQELSEYRHTQAPASASWVIEHNLNTSTPVVQVYVDGQIVTPDEIIIIDPNTINVTFLQPQLGTATLLSGSPFGIPATNPAVTQVFAAATSWTLQHNLGRQPMVRIYSNGVEVQPAELAVTDTDVTVSFGTLSVGGTLILL